MKNILKDVENTLKEENIKYFIPPVAQQNEDEIIDYHLCNQKRSTYIKSHGRKNACGLCMVVCPFGAKDDN